jgi:hypothetical protein
VPLGHSAATLVHVARVARNSSADKSDPCNFIFRFMLWFLPMLCSEIKLTQAADLHANRAWVSCAAFLEVQKWLLVIQSFHW